MKVNKRELNNRIDIVTDWLLDGLKRREILQLIAKSPDIQWDVSSRQIDNYIAKANAIIEKNVEKDREKVFARVYNQFKRLYLKALSEKQYAVARGILNDIADLYGIRAPQKHALTDPTGEHEYTGIDDLRRETIDKLCQFVESFKVERIEPDTRIGRKMAARPEEQTTD